MSTKIKLVEYEDDGQILEAYHAYPEASTSPLKTILICHAWSGRSEFECVKAATTQKSAYCRKRDGSHRQVESGSYWLLLWWTLRARYGTCR